MSEKYDEIKAYLKAEALKPASRLRMPTIAELMRRFRASEVLRPSAFLPFSPSGDCRAAGKTTVRMKDAPQLTENRIFVSYCHMSLFFI